MTIVAPKRSAAEQLIFDRRPFWPREWPVIMPGLFMGFFDSCFVALHDDKMNAASYDRFVTELERTFGNPPSEKPRVTYFHFRGSPWWSAITLSEKSARLSAYSKVIEAHRDEIKRNVVAGALCTRSMVIRTAIRTALVFAPAASPIRIVSRPDEAFAFLGRFHPGFQAALPDVRVALRLVVNRFVPGLREDLADAP
ncbi:MAG: hypothetical protein IT381_01800 [Deltaproteobacteria bacterium]|nr:hypothetical protein [Deltaproteobacteria bacterium]